MKITESERAIFLRWEKTITVNQLAEALHMLTVRGFGAVEVEYEESNQPIGVNVIEVEKRGEKSTVRLI